jgi:hypothetical protein
MEHGQKRALIVGLGFVALFGGILLVIRCFEGKGDQKPLENIVQSQSLSVDIPVAEKKPPVTLLVITDPIENWEQCRNEKMGYEVKYPKGWKTYINGPEGNIPQPCGTTRSPGFVISPEDQYNVKKANFSVGYVDTSELGARSLEEYLQKNPGYLDEIYKETLIREERAVWTKSNDGYTNVFTYNNNKVFIIRERGISAESFNSFLSTFQFLP